MTPILANDGRTIIGPNGYRSRRYPVRMARCLASERGEGFEVRT